MTYASSQRLEACFHSDSRRRQHSSPTPASTALCLTVAAFTATAAAMTGHGGCFTTTELTLAARGQQPYYSQFTAARLIASGSAGSEPSPNLDSNSFLPRSK